MKIAIIGKMCSGKTTTANMIKQMDSRYDIFSFGQKIKDIAVDLFDMKEKNRSLLISIGTKMREIDPDVWINYVMNQVKNKEYCIIDDLRYKNEYDSCVKNGFIFIKMDISSLMQEQRIIRMYPNNYEDHLQNINHHSEKNEWFTSKKYYLNINSEEDIKKVEQKLYLLLFKNELS